MKNILNYLISEIPIIFIYLFASIIIIICANSIREDKTILFLNIQNYSKSEVLVKYSVNDYELLTKGEYVVHGNLITSIDRSKTSVLYTWASILMSIVCTYIIYFCYKGKLSQNALHTHREMKNIYVDIKDHKFYYIYDGVLLYTSDWLLPLGEILYKQLDCYFYNPKTYKHYE